MSNKIVLITGATSGFGKATAFEFAAKGYDIIITGRRAERLQELSKELMEIHSSKVISLTFDVQKNEEVSIALNTLSPEWRNISVLVNNAGLSMGLDPFHSANMDDWNVMIDTNLKGLLYVSKIISQWMVERKTGHIINLGSIAGKETYANGNVYCATKHAVDSISKAMRIDLLNFGIRVSVVHPGAAETEFSIVRFKGDENRAKQVYAGFEPLHPQDIAEAIYFIASRPAHVTINELTIMPTAQANATTINRIL